MAAFVERIVLSGVVVDVGCGLGYVTADLTRRGLDVVGCDPSSGMLSLARRTHPHAVFVQDDAALTGVVDTVAAILARFSLIHVAPDDVGGILQSWADRLRPGAPVLIAVQSYDVRGPATPFDHAVAPAWRWHPDDLSELLADHGFDEEWRVVNRPNDIHRFPGLHLLSIRR